jgi:hypothetical protein
MERPPNVGKSTRRAGMQFSILKFTSHFADYFVLRLQRDNRIAAG